MTISAANNFGRMPKLALRCARARTGAPLRVPKKRHKMKDVALVISLALAVFGFTFGLFKTFDKEFQEPLIECHCPDVSAATQAELDDLERQLAKAVEWRKIAEFKHLVCDTERVLRILN